ncbi:MAG: extracellular solute-binding protein [Gammaproteobacteria bacterium]|nr:extracellular solute-binding protein [Gammaproteobacteria bacterium]
MDILPLMQEILADWTGVFFDPRKRLFWGYLCSALLIALLWMILLKQNHPYQACKKIFSREVWCSKSAKADYMVFLINTLLLGSILPRLLGHAAVATFCFTILHEIFTGRPSLLPDVPAPFIALAFTLTLFVVDDFARYIVHRLFHAVPVLWVFHKVHHSATRLNPMTVLRTHPVEAIVFALRGALVQGVCIGVFVFCFSDKVTLIMILGANALKFAFNALGSNLRHSEVPIRYWRWLENILLSPAQHQIHHSVEPRHHDRNFGVALACWDRWFGTHCYSEPNQSLRYGLRNSTSNQNTFYSIYIRPFNEGARHIQGSIRKIGHSLRCMPVTSTNLLCRKISMKMNPVKSKFLCMTMVLIMMSGISVTAFAQDIVNIYSARKEALILPLLERFETETGIRFRLVTGKADGLLKRIEIEGDATPADIFITVDAGRLEQAKASGILQPVNNSVLNQKIPQHLRDQHNYWFGLSRRARVIFYARDRVDPSELSTYEDLAEEKWRGRLCIRSSGNIYNQSLVASMIEHLGEERTEKWARGLVANFARKPGGGDTDQLRAVAAGQCDITVVNTYYFGRLVNSNDEKDRQVAEKLDIFWPNQDGRGAHVNVSGAGIVRHSEHKATAETLLEFLVNAESQAWYAEVNNEYPVVPGSEISKTMQSLGEFKSDSLNLTMLGENNKRALQLMDRAGWR